MPAEFTSADSLREYLTGAASDGGAQTAPDLSLGGHRSSTEVVTFGISLANPVPNVYVDYASGSNPPGAGSLLSDGVSVLQWRPAGDANYGPPTVFNGVGVKGTVEAAGRPGNFLRLTVTTPLNPGNATVTLSYIRNTFYGFPDVTAAQATAGIIQYRAAMLKNVGGSAVVNVKKFLATLGTVRGSDVAALGSSGAGFITTSGSLADWPTSGWCQVRAADGSLREVVYYASRTNASLTIPTSGRSLLGTSASAGVLSDLIYPVPGLAVAVDPAGVIEAGTGVQTVASATTSPSGVTWNTGLTEATGVQVGDLAPGQQAAIWVKRHVPAGAVAGPSFLNKVYDHFNAF